MVSDVKASVSSARRFSTDDMKQIKKSEEKQQDFRALVLKSKALSPAQKNALECKDLKGFKEFWALTNNSKAGFDQNHETGYKKHVRRFEESADDVCRFMDNFSPIVNAVKDLAHPYGGIAVGVISILFTVAKSKHGIEERLQSTIAAVNDRLPGLEVYKRIYNDDHLLDHTLQAQIVAAYNAFLDFSMVATRYYLGGDLRRWLRALSSSAFFENEAKKVQEVIVEIRLKCEELLNKNVDTVKRELDNVKTINLEISTKLDTVKADNLKQVEQIKFLENRIKQMQDGDDNTRLRKVRRLFRLDTFSEETQRRELEIHRQSLSSDEELNVDYLQQMRGRGLELFKNHLDYQQWYKSRQQMLIIYGCNNESVSDSDHCWMSPLALSMIENLSQEKEMHAYSVLPQAGRLIYDVFPAILLQLLRRKVSAMRDEDRFNELCSELEALQEFENRGPKLETYEIDKLEALHRVGLRVIDFFNENDSIYIIVDRVDRCRDFKTIDHRKLLLECLRRLADGAKCGLKILVVVDKRGWPKNYEENIRREVKSGKVVIHTAEQKLQS